MGDLFLLKEGIYVIRKNVAYRQVLMEKSLFFLYYHPLDINSESIKKERSVDRSFCEAEEN
jgi:hypothetical protein